MAEIHSLTKASVGENIALIWYDHLLEQIGANGVGVGGHISAKRVTYTFRENHIPCATRIM